MRVVPVCGVVLIALGASGGAGADTLEATYDSGGNGSGQLSETVHQVRITRRGRYVHYDVTRSIRNSGKRVEEATLSIDMPSRAVARRLRLRAGRRWIEGKLLDADKADERYTDLTTQGKPARRGPAILAWESKESLKLRVFPVPPGGSVTMRYELTAPLCYRRGVYWADYPRAGTDDGTRPRIRVPRTGRAVSRAWLANQLQGEQDLTAPCELPEDDAGDIALLAFQDKRRFDVRASLATHMVKGRRGLVGITVDVAAKLAQIPTGAHVVFVIDASHSVGAAGIAAQLELMAGYLAHVPDARVKVVAYRRHAELIVATWRSARSLRAQIAGGTIRVTPDNGSHLDRGLAAGASALARARGPLRMVAFTDSNWRSAFTSAHARGALARLPARAVVHVVDVSVTSGAWAMERDDDHVLASVAAHHGGITAGLSGARGHGADAIPAMLGLVRPIRIDNVSLRGAGAAPIANEFPDTLPEGTSVQQIHVTDRVPTALTLRGNVWGRVFSRRLTPGTAASRLLPAVVFGDEASNQLPGEWIPPLARAGRVVSSATSLLAHDPRVRPSAYDENIGISSTCSCATPMVRGIAGIGRAGTIGRATERRSTEHLMRSLVWPAVNGCALSAGRDVFDLSVDVQTNTIEVLDVTVTGAPTKPMQTCIESAVWKLQLPAEFAPTSRSYKNRFRWPVR